MEYKVNQQFGSGVLYNDKDIICIKDKDNHLVVYGYSPEFKELLTFDLSAKTNQVGRYAEGIYYFQDRNTYFHSFTEKENNKIENTFFYNISSDYKAYTVLSKKDFIVFVSDRHVEIPILQSGGQKLFLDKGLVQVGRKNGLIAYYNVLRDAEILWQHSFSELIGSEKATLRGDIIETKGKLFFVVSGTLFCVDTHSGEILHKFEGLGRPIFQDQDHIYTTKYENILCRINPNTYKLEQWDANQLIKDNGIESIQDHRCTAHNGLFYFTQSLGDIKAKLGVLDFDKKELLFKHEFEPQNGAIGSIQANDNRIFVHTQDNTLHIFEKE